MILRAAPLLLAAAAASGAPSASVTIRADRVLDGRGGRIERPVIVAVEGGDGNPLEDIGAVLRVVFVMKNGTVYRNAAPPR